MFISTVLQSKVLIPESYEGRIVDVKSNYYIVKVEGIKVVLYTQENLNFNDIISFNGEYLKIESINSKTAFNFQKYMNHQKIYYSIKPKTLTLVKKGFGIRNSIMNRIDNHSTQEYLKKVFFGINDLELTSNLSNLLISSGVMIRSLIQLIKKGLRKRYYEHKVFIIEIIMYCMYMFIFKSYSLCLYIILTRLLSKSKLERFDQISLSAIIIIIIFPYYLFTLSFMISFLYKFIGFVQEDRNKFVVNVLIFIPVQLITFYKCNLMELLLYSYYRVINLVAFILACIDLLFGTSISYWISSTLLFNVDILTVTGHMTLVILFLWVFIGLLILQKITMPKVALLCSLLILNQHQLLFNPSFIYTQLYIGQGDAAILKYPFKTKVMMIDTGSKFNRRLLQSHLDYYGIKRISHLVISHDDEDHSGNKEFILNNYDVTHLIEDSASFNFYNLPIQSVRYDYDNDNDASLITSFSVNKNNYLSLGDVSSYVEERFLNDYDTEWNIIKLSHHGSKTGSSEKLLEKDTIKFLINSSGVNNMYKHPSDEVLKRIYDYDQVLFDTQVLGDVEIKHFLSYDFIIY